MRWDNWGLSQTEKVSQFGTVPNCDKKGMRLWIIHYG